MLYASIIGSQGFTSLDTAVQSLLQSSGGESAPDVLWKMQFAQYARETSTATPQSGSGDASNVTSLQQLSTEVVLEDSMLDDVKSAYLKITGENAEHFMRFEAREGAQHDDE